DVLQEVISSSTSTVSLSTGKPTEEVNRAAGVAEEALYTALEEAQGVGIIEQSKTQGGVAYRFAHALFRQTLYEEMFAPRRIRLHQRVGRAMEKVFGKRLDEHASEMAEHFAQSTEPEDLTKALRYSE